MDIPEQDLNLTPRWEVEPISCELSGHYACNSRRSSHELILVIISLYLLGRALRGYDVLFMTMAVTSHVHSHCPSQGRE